MNAKNLVLWISLFVIALLAGLSVTRAQTTVKTDAVTAISNLENDGVKCRFGWRTQPFTRKLWLMTGTREPIATATYYTKAELLNLTG